MEDMSTNELTCSLRPRVFNNTTVLTPLRPLSPLTSHAASKKSPMASNGFSPPTRSEPGKSKAFASA